ncbi:MAG TPA: hypothetical protein GXX29_13835 [Firmicutes bacterium]|nr:hypothetical protein [Bacillota bacterium]
MARPSNASGTMPDFIPPMLAVTGELPDTEDFLNEPKWDGLRCQAWFRDGGLRLLSRNGKELLPRFPELSCLTGLIKGTDWIIDGELIVIGAGGLPDFDLVRNRNMTSIPGHIAKLAAQYPATFAAFDLLYLNGAPMLARPLRERREMLHGLFEENPCLIKTPGLIGSGKTFWQMLARDGWEGLVAKRLDSPYIPGKRSTHWIKVRNVREIDCVVGGFIGQGRAESADGTLQSLLLGQYTAGGELIYIGHVGTGFSTAERRSLLRILLSLRLKSGAGPLLLHVPREHAKDAVWVQPNLVCSVQFLTWTGGGLLRHPVFKGWRTDKEPHECRLEADHPLVRQEGVLQP